MGVDSFVAPYVIQVNDSVLYALVTHCRSLTSLNISHRRNFSADALSALAQLPQLQSICAIQGVNLSGGVLANIATGCTLLQDVYLCHCPHLSSVARTLLQTAH